MGDPLNSQEEPENPKIDNIINVSDKKKTNIRKKEKNLSLKEKKRLGLAIASNLSEFLDSYITIGFDVNGNSVVLINSCNEMETRALTDLLGEFMARSNFISNDFDE